MCVLIMMKYEENNEKDDIDLVTPTLVPDRLLYHPY